MSDEWAIRWATRDDRAAAAALLQRAFGPDVGARTAALWDWLFVRNPAADDMYYLVADAGDRLAGQYATAPLDVVHGGRRLKALLSLHTATDPDFERRGIFRELADTLYRETSERAAIVFGFPNPASAPVFYSRLAWTELRPFPLRVRVLPAARGRMRALAAISRSVDLARPRRLAGESIELLPEFGPWADTLWRSLAPRFGTAVVRDARYLRWRYFDGPQDYLRLALVRAGEPVGFGVVGYAPHRGATAAYVLELLTPPGDARGALLLLRELLDAAAGRGAAAALALVTPAHPQLAAFRRAGFVAVPGRIRTSFSFGVRSNGPDADPRLLLERDRWYLSGGDLDFV